MSKTKAEQLEKIIESVLETIDLDNFMKNTTESIKDKINYFRNNIEIKKQPKNQFIATILEMEYQEFDSDMNSLFDAIHEAQKKFGDEFVLKLNSEYKVKVGDIKFFDMLRHRTFHRDILFNVLSTF